MKYCYNCGKEIDEKAVICVHCGVAQDKHSATPDAPSTALAFLCFFIPLLGLILYLVYKDTQPLKAKSCGKGALIGLIVGIALTVLCLILYFVFIFAMLGAYIY